ncbi:carbohydrate kinase family protein [Sandarakinorhabdus sp.]|uniref:carbohydrate kinase family protein n=1 Tax=Sandarakinorhabdus sp. TaxID=1916663 RepID=UPI00334182FF
MARVLVTGSLGWDVPLWLDAPLKSGGRISARSLPPQNGGTALPGRLGGGAANIASALTLAGHEVLVVGRVGQDAAGQYIFYALDARGLSLDGIRVDSAPTPSLQILIEPSGERTILGIGGKRAWQRWAMAAELVQRFAPDALILRSSVPALPGGVGLCKGRLVVAHMPWLGDRPDRVDVAVGSVDDLGSDAWDQPHSAAAAVFGAVEWGVVTAGAAGARAGRADTMIEEPAVPATVVDATGAGDIFIAGLTDALLADAAPARALAHACLWAAAAVSMEGSAPERGAPGFCRFTR